MSDHEDVPSAKPGFSFRGRLRSFVYAGRGLRWLIRDEHNAWLHLAASSAVVVAGIALQISLEDWRWLVISIALVWIAEGINTAIEELCDHVRPQFDPSIGRIKDIAAGGVLAASIAAAIIGSLTLGPPFFDWIASPP